MASGTLYTYPESHRAYKILIAADYSGANVKVDPNFEFGKTNISNDFLKKFPMGKVPTFEDSEGNCLSESNAIVRYVANQALLGGSSAINQALVQQYVEFSENEILPSACQWTFPTLGFKQYNKQETEKAINHIKKCLTILNDSLLTKTFLVGERITLADISLVTGLLTLYVQVMDPNFREPYQNLNRWFLTCINQPSFKKILGEVELCKKMAVFDTKRYQDLHANQKQGKKGKEPKKKEPKPVKTKTKKDDGEEETPAPPTTKKAADYFADAPESGFVMDDWKKMYSNNATDVSLPWFYENYDKNGYSIWHCTYQNDSENTVGFMTNNLMNGFINRLFGLTKYAFGIMLVTNLVDSACFNIHGIWVVRGARQPFALNPDWNVDSEWYDWKQLHLDNSEDKSIFEQYFHLVDEDRYTGYSCFK